MGMASVRSLENVQTIATHGGTSGHECLLTVSTSTSPSGVQATQLGIRAASFAPTNAVSTAATPPTITRSNAPPALNKSFNPL
jgi:hypothetical protein